MAEKFEADMRSRFHRTYHHRQHGSIRNNLLSTNARSLLMLARARRGNVRRRNEQGTERHSQEFYKNKMMVYLDERKKNQYRDIPRRE